MLKARSANRSATTPKAPGGRRTPHRPGTVPDHSTIPGHFFIQAPAPLGAPIRPGSQYLTAESLGDFLPTLDEIAEPADFEQAPSSDEEMRKALPWHTPPRRPTPWFSFSDQFAETDPALSAGPDALALAAETLATE